MKKIILSIVLILVAFLVIIGNNLRSQTEQDDKYCAKLKDGIISVYHQGSLVTADVMLENGIVLKMDGTVIKKNGSRMTLKDGECIHKDGTISEKSSKTTQK